MPLGHYLYNNNNYNHKIPRKEVLNVFLNDYAKIQIIPKKNS